MTPYPEISQALRDRLKRPASRDKRPVGGKKLLRYFLVVSEGAKTERLYFEEFARELPRNMVIAHGLGDNTLNVVQKGIRHRDNRAKNPFLPDFDEVWAVFDLDDFPHQNFNNAIFKCKEKGMGCAYSVEAFELWYLLHFNYMDARLHRKDYNKKLSEYLKFDYKKARPGMYALLKPHQENALRWAEKLYKRYSHHDPAEEDPSTTVFLLVKRLNEFLM